MHFTAGSVLDVLNDEEVLVDVGIDVVLKLDDDAGVAMMLDDERTVLVDICEDEDDCMLELEVGPGQPDEDGTALTPLPITTRFVPQLAAGARWRLKLSTSYTTSLVSI